jgi:hypothetical protein
MWGRSHRLVSPQPPRFHGTGKVRRAHRDRRVSPVRPAHRDRLERRVQWALLVHRDRSAHQGRLAFSAPTTMSHLRAHRPGAECTIGDVILTASTEVATNWLPAKGQTLPIESYTALFSLIGVDYGGNGTSNFDLPNLTATAPMGVPTSSAYPGSSPESLSPVYSESSGKMNAN